MGYREFLDLALEEELGVREGRRFRERPQAQRPAPSQGPRRVRLRLPAAARRAQGARPRDARLRRAARPTSACWARPGWARRCSPWGSRSPPARRATRSTSRASTTWCATCARRRATGRFAKKLQTYLKPAVLVLDEVGYLPLSRAEGNMVFQLVSRRYERGSIILTSNKTFAEMGQVFGDEVLASAILDRLLHHAEVISINGPSYRLKDRMLEQRDGGDGRLQS